MKIVGLISDTHIPARAKTIPSQVYEVFKGVSLIIHAGDLTQLNVLRELERLAPVVAVQGNMDAPNVKAELPTMNFVQVANFKVGVVHSLGVFRAKQKLKRVLRRINLTCLFTVTFIHLLSVGKTICYSSTRVAQRILCYLS